ncbi:MAG: hypothetical protein IJD28_00360 [Deferribacterales bacterium]|nr:hypothetical protein [Deferribacterales bacterium]
MEIYIILWIVFAVVSALIASQKNRNVAGWFIGGLFLGIIALIILAFLPKIAKEV